MKNKHFNALMTKKNKIYYKGALVTNRGLDRYEEVDRLVICQI